MTKVVAVYDVVCLWSAIRYVKVTIAVDTIEAIPASLVEVDELSCALEPAVRAIASDLIEEVTIRAKWREIP